MNAIQGLLIHANGSNVSGAAGRDPYGQRELDFRPTGEERSAVVEIRSPCTFVIELSDEVVLAGNLGADLN